MKRNADGQYPKHYDHTKLELYEKMGLDLKQMKALAARWNDLIMQNLDISYFLQEADMRFTKHELLLLFTLSHNQ
jgi:uncharacterized protein YktB (UPF0637 family)